MLSPLFARAVRERLRGIFGWTAGLVGFIAVEIAVYPTVRDSSKDWAQLTETFPEAFRKIFRMTDYTSVPGFLSTELFSLIIPLIFVGIGTSWGARAAAEEEEDGTADILLSLPVSRSAVLLTRAAATFAVLAAVAAAGAVSLVIAMSIAGMSLGFTFVLAGFVTNLLLGTLFAALALLIGCMSGRRSAALGASIAASVAAFVIYSLAPLVPVFDMVLPFNPFQWTVGTRPLFDGIDAAQSLLALVVSAAMSALAVRACSRRDIRA